MTPAEDLRLRRLRMRSMRRGIKEMDLILSGFAQAHLGALSARELDDYEALLEEDDHDLYLWITGQHPAPPALAALVARIAAILPGPGMA
jgi:antitoxin CptB